MANEMDEQIFNRFNRLPLTEMMSTTRKIEMRAEHLRIGAHRIISVPNAWEWRALLSLWEEIGTYIYFHNTDLSCSGELC
jgi:hypothetical protein